MSATGEFQYRSLDGTFKKGEVSLYDYEMAHNRNMRAHQLVNQRYADADPRFGTAWEQGMRSVGVYAKNDPKLGIQATTIKDIMSGACMANAGPAFAMASGGGQIVAPSGPVGGSTPASRFFLPEAILQRVEEVLTEDYNPEVAAFNSMVAVTDTISGPIYTIPKIDQTSPRDVDARTIVQNNLPRDMLSISASQVSHAVGVESLGLQITDEATQLSTLDLVGIIVAQQAEGSRFRRLWQDLSHVVTGNVDVGEAALPVTNFRATYDPAAAAGEITQTGWITMLWDKTRRLRIDTLILTIADYLAVQNRTGRPLMFDPNTGSINMGNAGSYGLDATMTAPMNMSLMGIPRVLIVPDGLWPAKHILAFDSRFALRRVINSSAAYSASEGIILTRSSVMRWDYSEIVHRLRPESFLFVDYGT